MKIYATMIVQRRLATLKLGDVFSQKDRHGRDRKLMVVSVEPVGPELLQFAFAEIDQ